MTSLSQRVWHVSATAALLRARTPIAWLALVVGGGLALRALPPALRWNVSPSEPEGVYGRALGDAPIKRGQIVAFMAPPPAFPYADKRLGHLHSEPILKAVAATAGDRVCARQGLLSINGQVVAPIQERDAHGDLLPHWTQCRRLRPGELFVFSARIPNSFDSRYYGPVQASAAEVYRPLVTVNGIGR